MKLLSANEVILKKKSQEEIELYEAHKAKKRLIEETDKLKEFKNGITPEKKKIVSEYLNFVQKLEKQKSELLGEIQSLENIKKHILDPIDEIKMDVMEREEKILLAEKEFYNKQKKFNEKIELFNKKLNILEDKEQEIAKRDVMSSNNYKNSEVRLKVIIEYEKKHAEIKEQLSSYEIQLKNKEKELLEREVDVKNKFKAIVAKEENVKKTLKIIDSRQAQLKSAYQELKKHA